MLNEPISLTDPASQLAEIQRRQRLADLLQQQGQEQIPIYSYNGIQAPIPVTAVLAKVLNSYLGGRAAYKASQEQSDLEKAQRKEALDLVNRISAPTQSDLTPPGFRPGPGPAAYPPNIAPPVAGPPMSAQPPAAGMPMPVQVQPADLATQGPPPSYAHPTTGAEREQMALQAMVGGNPYLAKVAPVLYSQAEKDTERERQRAEIDQLPFDEQQKGLLRRMVEAPPAVASVIGNILKPPTPTDLQRNYETARQQGYTGSFIDYQKETNPNRFIEKFGPNQQAYVSTDLLNPNATGQSRGLRNNNPLNLTVPSSGAWPGQTGTDGKFAVFATPQAGLAAADQNLQSYAKQGITTLQGIISKWAPPSENDTAAYINTVAKDTGINPTQSLNLADPNVRQTVLQSMAKVELGGSSGGGPKPVVTTASASPAAALSDAAVTNAAQTYIATGKMPALGFGGGPMRAQVLNRVAEINAAGGINGYNNAAGAATFHANAQALAAVSRLANQVGSFEKTASKNADLALSLAPQGGGPTGVPVVNRWLQAGRKSVAGDPAVTKFDVALGTFLDEYAKVVTGGVGSQAVTDSARREAYDRISKYAAQGQLQGGIATMKQEMANRLGGFAEQQAQLSGALLPGGVAPGAVSPAPVPAPPRRLTDAELKAKYGLK